MILESEKFHAFELAGWESIPDDYHQAFGTLTVQAIDPLLATRAQWALLVELHLAEAAKVRNSSVRSFMYSMMVSQPRRLVMSVGSCFQSRWSRAHSRSTAWDAESRAFAAATRD